MDKPYPPEAWKRLGEALERRRGELGYGFRQREQFLRDRGGPPPSLKTIARLERGERTSYPPATVTRLEALYGYAPGSFEAVLRGGDPSPLPARAEPRLHRVPAPPPGGAPFEEILAWLLDRHPDDPAVQALGAQASPAAPGLSPPKTAETVVGEIGDFLRWRESRTRGEAGSASAG